MVVGTAPNLTTIPDLALFLNGTINATSVTVAYSGTGNIYSLTFTPQATGIFNLYCFAGMQARINVVNQSIYSYLQNIEDEAVGSWVWDKVAGTLNMLRQNGTALASFNVVDNLTTASRELI
ncbi:MAG TPA: hypothetical protein VN922_18680 [Bacteroidia bacterium]|nr:hypothetical protein [Bacteroidia bacterium]